MYPALLRSLVIKLSGRCTYLKYPSKIEGEFQNIFPNIYDAYLEKTRSIYLEN